MFKSIVNFIYDFFFFKEFLILYYFYVYINIYFLNLLELLYGIYCVYFDFEMIDNCLVFLDYVESIYKLGNYVILVYCVEYLNFNYESMYIYNIYYKYYKIKCFINLLFICKLF